MYFGVAVFVLIAGQEHLPSEDFCKLAKNIIPIIGILDGEFSFVENVIEIEKHFSFAILAKKDLHGRPMSRRASKKAPSGE